MSGFPINFDAEAFKRSAEALANASVVEQPAPLTLLNYPAGLASPKMDGAVPAILQMDFAAVEGHLRQQTQINHVGHSPEDVLKQLVPDNHPEMPKMVPQTPEEHAFFERARRLVGDRLSRAAQEQSKGSQPPARTAVAPRPSVAVALPPASKEELLQEAFRAMTAALNAGGDLGCSVPDSWFSGIHMTLHVSTLEKKEEKAFMAEKLRSLGAKVSFSIGEEKYPPREGKSSFKHPSGASRVSAKVVSQLKGPLIKILQTGPKTIKQIEELLAPDNYDYANYFNINQLLHTMGCIKTEGERQPSDRGPRYAWSLPPVEAAG